MTTNDDPVVSAIQLPRDQYGHEGAPTEWWWHVGTLKTADGRAFGFEVNACGVLAGLAFTEIAITDLQNQVHYQIVNDMSPVPANWAVYDPTQPWFVSLPGIESTTNGAVSMTAIGGNPMNMAVEATFTDSVTNAECAISLTLYDQGPPLLVWGTGVHIVDPSAPTPITQNNYYYSLTNLQASGTITINGEVSQVTGLTWMDHEYGAFPNPPGGKNVWTLQDMQLGNGLHLSNFTQFQVKPQNNVPMPSNATLLLPGGESVFVETVTTPSDPQMINGDEYFMKFNVEIKTPGHAHISFLVESLFPNQVFTDPTHLNNGYEGVAECTMMIDFQISEKIKRHLVVSTGTAWIEQSMGYSS